MKKQLLLFIRSNGVILQDINSIAVEIKRVSPAIEITLATEGDTVETITANNWRFPTVTVALGTRLVGLVPPRGAIFENRELSKLDQFNRFTSAGIKTPLTAVFRTRDSYAEANWGEFIILKPLPLRLTGKGGSARLLRTRTLAEIAPSRLPEDHILRKSPVLVQQFIDTGRFPSKWRVLSLFGEPLYSSFSQSMVPRTDLDADDAAIAASVIEPRTPENKEADLEGLRDKLAIDKEVLAFARLIHGAFARIPLMGIDILREETSGNLYALEVNAGGNVWHFSSYAELHRERLGGKQRMIDQFGAWSAAARALIHIVNEHAC